MKRAAHAFTLIELLVVVTIIAILAGLALPVFSSVQEKARITQDLNNLRQLGIGTQTYANDHDGNFFSTDQAASPWMKDLHPKILPSWKIFQSPFDKRSSIESDTTSPISYGLNKNVAGFNLDRVERPSVFILFGPAQTSATTVKFSGTPASAVTVLRNSSVPGGAPTGGTQVKRQRINALFADLHADSMTWTIFKEVASGVPGADSNYRWEIKP